MRVRERDGEKEGLLAISPFILEWDRLAVEVTNDIFHGSEYYSARCNTVGERECQMLCGWG